RRDEARRRRRGDRPGLHQARVRRGVPGQPPPRTVAGGRAGGRARRRDGAPRGAVAGYLSSFARTLISWNAMAKTQALPTQAEDFSGWYNDIVYRAELVDLSPVRGSFVIRPYGYALWE